MSKGLNARQRQRRQPAASPARTVEPRGAAPRAEGPPDWARPPLTPQRKALAVLSVALALWVAFLLGLYVKSMSPGGGNVAPGEALPATSTSR